MASIKAESFISTACQTIFFFRSVLSGPVHTTPAKFENAALFLRFGLPSTTFCYKVFSWKRVKANIRTVILSRWTVGRRIAAITNSQRCLLVLWKCARNEAMLPRTCPRLTKKSENEKIKSGHTIKCFLTEWGRAGLENIWFSSWPKAKYFPVRPSHSVNK